METAVKKLFLVAVLLVAISSKGVLKVSNAQTICNMSASGLMACKPSVTRPNPTPPSANCCTALSHADLHCLCSYKNSTVLPSLGIDPDLALQLPGKCKLPHAAHC
ncbi:putative lipid-transfer protein DIR1 [Morella rubra]|uniref:Putative lipid-transfer protein DIR1 n=1 Tax=Morella rubra TaxID=262757 RepID=A0A6A1VKY6_9ROSI|nr:putative lipid-transfer protein DIR1 [Morella rubra]KAB1213404.1 putative lipid-transfer protein DIR1 [Morella rubra]